MVLVPGFLERHLIGYWLPFDCFSEIIWTYRLFFQQPPDDAGRADADAAALGDVAAPQAQDAAAAVAAAVVDGAAPAQPRRGAPSRPIDGRRR